MAEERAVSGMTWITPPTRASMTANTMIAMTQIRQYHRKTSEVCTISQSDVSSSDTPYQLFQPIAPKKTTDTTKPKPKPKERTPFDTEKHDRGENDENAESTDRDMLDDPADQVEPAEDLVVQPLVDYSSRMMQLIVSNVAGEKPLEAKCTADSEVDGQQTVQNANVGDHNYDVMPDYLRDMLDDE